MSAGSRRSLETFARAVASAGAERGASWTRVGLEQAGHYHQVLLARLIHHGFDVVLLNPAHVRASVLDRPGVPGLHGSTRLVREGGVEIGSEGGTGGAECRWTDGLLRPGHGCPG